MRELSTKILIGVLCITLVVPTVFFMRPQKAEALLSVAQCLAAKLTALGTVLGPSLANAVLSVGVSEKVVAGATATAPAGSDWGACFMKAIAKLIAKTILHTFTQSIVNWINTGFKGSPSFVTNPEGFLNDIADQTIGQVIEQISPLLCSPFKLDIRLSLGLNMSLNTKEDIHCRLSDVMANVHGAYDGFVQGTVGSGNLNQWIHIAGTPQNNPYGAYIATTNKLGLGITTATGEQIKLLDWGEGFKSWRPCKVEGDPIEVKDKNGMTIEVDGQEGVAKTRKGPCKEYGPIQTPGSIIQSSATGALGTTLKELEVASEIDEVVGALINQLMVKVMTGVGGLLGSSKGDVTNDGQSYVDSLLTDPTKAVSASDAKVPDGIDCGLSYYPTTVESPKDSKIYVADEKVHQVWTANLGKNLADKRPLVEATYLKDATPLKITKPANQSWKDYFIAIEAGCANETATFITNTSTNALDAYKPGGSFGKEVSPEPATPPKTNVDRVIQLTSAALNQSYVFEGLGPQNALHGSKYSYSETFGGPSPHWWTASLNQNELVKVIHITVHPDGGVPNLEDITVSLARLPDNSEKRGIPITPADVRQDTMFTYPENSTAYTSVYDGGNKKSLTITLTQPVSANALVISNPNRLTLTEVKLYRPLEITDTKVTPTAFTFVAVPEKVKLVRPTDWETGSYNEDGRLNWRNISFTPNKKQDGITFRAQLYKCNPSGSTLPVSCPENNYVLESFTNQFNSLRFTYKINTTSTVVNVIENKGAGYTYTAAAQSEPGHPENGVLFASNVELYDTSPVFVSLNGSARNSIPLRIVIQAYKVVGTTWNLVGTAKADFATGQ